MKPAEPSATINAAATTSPKDRTPGTMFGSTSRADAPGRSPSLYAAVTNSRLTTLGVFARATRTMSGGEDRQAAGELVTDGRTIVVTAMRKIRAETPA